MIASAVKRTAFALSPEFHDESMVTRDALRLIAGLSRDCESTNAKAASAFCFYLYWNLWQLLIDLLCLFSFHYASLPDICNLSLDFFNRRSQRTPRPLPDKAINPEAAMSRSLEDYIDYSIGTRRAHALLCFWILNDRLSSAWFGVWGFIRTFAQRTANARSWHRHAGERERAQSIWMV